MTTAHLFALAWSPDPSVFGGSAALAAAYLAWTRRLGPRAWVFLAGVAALLFALVGPLDRIGELYLFSVHMLQHLVLILVVPPLLLWGLPPEATERLLAVPLVGRLERWFGRPAVALTVAIGALWAWHVPALYDLALRSESVHALEHMIFLVTATMFWWPVLTPVRSRRLSPPAAMAYLFAVMASDSALGAVLTFAPAPLYPFYLLPPDPYGALPLIRDVWHVSPLADQQMGGLAMWIPGGLFTIVAILIEFGLWFQEPEADELTEPRSAGAGGRPAERTLQSALEDGATDAAPIAGTHTGTAATLPQPASWFTPAVNRGILEGAR